MITDYYRKYFKFIQILNKYDTVTSFIATENSNELSHDITLKILSSDLKKNCKELVVEELSFDEYNKEIKNIEKTELIFEKVMS